MGARGDTSQMKAVGIAMVQAEGSAGDISVCCGCERVNRKGGCERVLKTCFC